jgi:secondary thiamine-phosphate synthase enzyme
MLTTLEIVSHHSAELIDITAAVRRTIRASGVIAGQALLFVPHTTAAITINENADPDVVTDILAGLERLVPADPSFRHAEGNSPAHIKSSLVGPSLALIIIDGAPLLGTWQGIYFCEFDGPRRRKLHVRVSGV